MNTHSYTVCPICSGELSTFSRFPRINACKDCYAGVSVNLDLINTADYNERPDLAVGYMDSEKKGSDYCAELLMYFIELTGKREGRLLDVGCSIGTLVNQAKLLGFTANGVDLDSNAIKLGIKLGRAVSNDNLSSLSDCSFDIIVLQHTLEHIAAPYPFMEEIRTKLKPDGYLLISVPNYRCALVSTIAERWYGWQLNQHYLHYSPTAIETLISKAHFKIIKVSMNSMDHELSMRDFLKMSVKQKSLNLVKLTIVFIANLFRNGDQIYAIAQK